MYCPNPNCPDVEKTGKPSEYRDGIVECPRCHTALSFEPPDFGEDAAEAPALAGPLDFVSIGRFHEASAIRAAKVLLEQAGIAHVVRHDPGQQFSPWGRSVGGGLSFASVPEILVEPGRADEARSLLTVIEAEVSEHEVAPRQEEPGDTPVSLMRMADRRKRRAKESGLGRMFVMRPSRTKVVLFGAGAILCALWGFVLLQDATEVPTGPFMLAVILAVLAWDNRRRLRRAEDGNILPSRFPCPSCRKPIEFGADERRSRTFTCPSCREEFEVADDAD
jgi:hypothetical protein